MKKWIDAGEIAKVSDISERQVKFQKLMEEVPRFKNHGARKIYQRKHFAIYKVKEGYIVHNLNKRFEKGHSHIRSYPKAKSLIDLAIRKKLPTTLRPWEIESLKRISNDMTYINKLSEL